MSGQISRVIANKGLNTINTKFSYAGKREREMVEGKKEKGNSSKFLVADSLLPSIVDKEKKKRKGRLRSRMKRESEQEQEVSKRERKRDGEKHSILWKS